MSMNNDPIESLTRMLAKLPSLGPRSAKRIVLNLLQEKDTLMRPLAAQIIETAENVHECKICGNIDVQNPCHICQNDQRQTKTLCVVANVADLWAMERARSFKGQYHVLGGVLSALDGITPQDLKIGSLLTKLETEIEEIIFALPATVDGQSTAHYVAEKIKKSAPDIKITQLAHGVPMGGELDYLDEGTLMTALKSRSNL